MDIYLQFILGLMEKTADVCIQIAYILNTHAHKYIYSLLSFLFFFFHKKMCNMSNFIAEAFSIACTLCI